MAQLAPQRGELAWKIQTIYAPYAQFVKEVALGQEVHINVADVAMQAFAKQQLEMAGVRMDRIFFHFFRPTMPGAVTMAQPS